MSHVAVSSPLPNDYIKSNRHMFFSFHPDSFSFLSGYLGVNTAKISGSLLIRTPQEIEASEINLYFIGREKVEWGVDFRKAKAKDEYIIFNLHENLWTTSDPVGYELITELSLPFEFEVPSDAVESFESSFGSVRYTLKAVIIRNQKKKNKWVEVIVPILRWSQPPEEELSPLVLKSKDISQRKHQIGWEAELPKTFFDIGSKRFKVKLKIICRQPDLRIRKINSYLKGIFKYKANNLSFEKEQYCYKGEISGNDIIIVPNGVDIIFEVKVIIDIPSNILPTCQTKYMNIINEIQIKVIFERSNTFVLITREIFLGRNYNIDGESINELSD
ncbi:2378_t:CDS:1 [Funneliformis geosporum]|uniref:5140_t:CDS:1 n=1 Tax=Funneliformis geosporum TaxID=1117311 RepID=A0A9W4SS78_9GLOM|nr:5140_t:CDS:1 [Funneliformis geosporum]CAI2179679.1 2378_t:CDS:1 [Funneliformis geosporum]